MSEQSILWVGHPARADVLRLADAGLTVVAWPSLDDDGLVEPAVIVLTVERLAALPERLRGAAAVVALAPSLQAVPLLRAGAHDVVSPAVGMEELVLRVRRWAESPPQRRRVRELSARIRSLEAELAETRRTQDQLRSLALTDELTGLGNRRAFRQQLELWLAFVARHGGPLSLVALDLDDFKEINDGRGRAAGDTVLRKVAETLRRSIRCIDRAARLGDDDFALILPATDLHGARLVAERLRGHLAVRASFGVASVSGRQPPQAGDALIARPRRALPRQATGQGACRGRAAGIHSAYHRTMG